MNMFGIPKYIVDRLDDLAWEHELISSFREGTTRSSLEPGGSFMLNDQLAEGL
jgi:hypothetical protein